MLNTNLFLDCAKLRGYIVSEVNAVSSNPFVSLSKQKLRLLFHYHQYAHMSSFCFQKQLHFLQSLHP